MRNGYLVLALFAFTVILFSSQVFAQEAPTTPTITEQQAIEIAQQDYGMPAQNTSAELVFFAGVNVTLSSYTPRGNLSWKVLYSTNQTPSMTYFIDAENGNILYKDTGVRSTKINQEIHPNLSNDMQNFFIGSGIIVIVIIAGLVYFKRK